MSKKALYLLGILLTILIGTYFYWKYCCNGDLQGAVADDDTEKVVADDEPIPQDTKQITNNAFALNDANGNFSFNTNDNFNFNVSSFSILEPVSTEVAGGIDQLKGYLEQQGNKSVDITGLYASTEDNTSAYPNLGLARANAVKNYFTGKGIASSRINTFGKLWDDLGAQDGIYRGPVNFTISTGDDTSAQTAAAELKELGDRIKANPLVLYFASGSNSINLSAEQRQKVADISRYLDKMDGATAKVVGHTDNTGNRASNIRLAQGRADFAKDYLVNNGIPVAKVNASSKGPDEPIASNATEEGRAKNRRTVVTIN